MPQATLHQEELGDNMAPTNEMASQAMVIMAVGLRKQWKTPVAYHFTQGVGGDILATMIDDVIVRLYEAGRALVICFEVICDINPLRPDVTPV
jgi:hypothetical protein